MLRHHRAVFAPPRSPKTSGTYTVTLAVPGGSIRSTSRTRRDARQGSLTGCCKALAGWLAAGWRAGWWAGGLWRWLCLARQSMRGIIAYARRGARAAAAIAISGAPAQNHQRRRAERRPAIGGREDAAGRHPSVQALEGVPTSTEVLLVAAPAVSGCRLPRRLSSVGGHYDNTQFNGGCHLHWRCSTRTARGIRANRRRQKFLHSLG